MCLVKFKFDQHLFDKKILGGKKIKDTPFIGVRKINRKSDQKFLFSKNDHFYLFNKTYTLNITKIIVKC